MSILILHAPLPKDLDNPGGIPPIINYLFILIFGAAAVLLFLVGRQDERAISLGGFFLLIALAFCNRPTTLLITTGTGALKTTGLALGSLRPDIFIPFFLWRFVRDFPRSPTPSRIKRIFDAAIRLSVVTGLLFMSANLLRFLLAETLGPAAVPRWLYELAPKTGEGWYYLAMFALATPAFPFLVYKARLATGDEQKRVRLFTAGLVVGLTPVMLDTLSELLSTRFLHFKWEHHGFTRPYYFVLCAFALSAPLSTSYSVLVHRVLQVKLVARRAIQYALARYSALALATVPLVAVVVYLYRNREQALAHLFSGSRMLLLLSTSALGLATLYYRGRLLDSVDRRFFREQYDARQILTLLVERIRATSEGAALAKLISREIDLALHLESIAFMIEDPRSGMLVDPRDRSRRLDTSSPLGALISGTSDPLPTDLEEPRASLAGLPDKDRQWLAESGFRLIVPIPARDGTLLGIIGLGEKKSGLPFLKEDRQLLHAIASSAAWVLELEHSRSSTPRRPGGTTSPVLDSSLQESLPAAAELAKECPLCGTVYQAFTVFCIRCSRRLETAHVPYVLPGKFRFERRIGSGGMGVVYRGTDLALGRPVAVKTMRRVSPEDAMRLRREARTAATVAHPHLSSIYGIETWHGAPMLILELLEGGTLTQRIEQEKLTALETVDLGIMMAGALAQLHSADILHRDIKPSNIGYTRDGVPKLMDFGIARVMFDLRRDTGIDSGTTPDGSSALLPSTSIWTQSPGSATLSKQLVGTLSYLSPEALGGQRPDVTFDLWGLSIVLYECLLGRKVFTGADVRQLMTRIKQGRVPDFAQVCPEHDDCLRDFFRGAMHKTLSRRPGSAPELRRRLETVREQLGAKQAAAV
ncbi:MAG TPA: protein kinase [Thermoanaerobaculia bacterium]|nr:protein kinase [Thermoanaerobaculia bacterium]